MKKKPFIFIIIGVILLAIAGVGLYFALSGKLKQKIDSTKYEKEYRESYVDTTTDYMNDFYNDYVASTQEPKLVDEEKISTFEVISWTDEIANIPSIITGLTNKTLDYDFVTQLAQEVEYSTLVGILQEDETVWTDLIGTLEKDENGNYTNNYTPYSFVIYYTNEENNHVLMLTVDAYNELLATLKSED